MTSTIGVTLEGGEMDLHLWMPESGSGPGLLLLQEIFGVGPYIRAVAERLAQAGYVVGAPDVFWRFAPGWAAGHDQEGLEQSLAMMGHLDPEVAVADCVAALETLESMSRIRGGVGVLGFCLGGTLAWGVAVQAAPVVCVSYYGSGVADLIGMADSVSCPTLFHFGDADAYIPGEQIDVVAGAIGGRPGFVVNVEHAGHAFDNHESSMFYDEPAARAAWSKTMAFLAQHHPVS